MDWKEKLLKALPEGTTLDDSILDAMVGVVSSENTGLVNKNTELLTKMSGLKADRGNLQEKLKSFDPVVAL